MTLKTASVALLFGLLFTSCNLSQKAGNRSGSAEHTSKNSLDWQGTYYGVMPCASCPGIETELTLTNDQHYVLTRKYIDKGEATTTKGSFNWDKKGNQIILDGIKNGEAPSQYKIEEGRIRQLDMQNKEITGQLAQRYILTKNGNPNVEDKRWQLVELNGKAVKGDAKTHYIIFHAKDGRIEAKANCNIILSNYKIRNEYRLTITQGITTLMACPDNNLEKELINVLNKADNLSVTETKLSLNKARMAPLARFELVK